MTGKQLCLAWLIVLATSLPTWADEPRTVPRLFTWQHTEDRAGCPQKVAWYARPSQSPAFTGYYVGGGSAVGGSCRYTDEGTWGWDYKSCFLPRRVLLYWSHGARYQGGTGAYRPDGGPEVPDVPGLLNPQLYSLHKKDHAKE